MKTCTGSVGKRQAMKLAEDASRDFESFSTNSKRLRSKLTDDLLVLSFDGKRAGLCALTGLRECTRKKCRKKAKKKQQTRLSPGEKKDRKRMAQVATIYTIKPDYRTAESIMNLDKQDKNVVRLRPPIRNKRVWASVEREQEDVIEEAF